MTILIQHSSIDTISNTVDSTTLLKMLFSI